MKKLLLGLGTIAAVTAPVVSVVACSSDDRNHQKGSLKANLRVSFYEANKHLSLRYSYPKDWNDELASLQQMINKEHSNTPRSQGILRMKPVNGTDVVYIHYDFEKWIKGVEFSFNYKLDFNDDNRAKVFYEMNLSNVHIVDEDKLIGEIEETHLDLDNLEFSMWYPLEMDKVTPDIYDMEVHMYKELEELNRDMIENKVHEAKTKLIKDIIGGNIAGIASSKLEESVTNGTPVKYKSGAHTIDFNYFK